MLIALILACSADGGFGSTEADVALTQGAGSRDAVAQEGTDPNAPIEAMATLEARSGSRMTGIVTFIQQPTGDTTTTPTGIPDGADKPGADAGMPSPTPGTATPGADQPGMGGGLGQNGASPGGLGQNGMPQPGGDAGAQTPGAPPTGAVGAAPIEVSIRLVNATPGNHAVFLHENGDCSAPDASSAGGFYGTGATPAQPSGVTPSGTTPSGATPSGVTPSGTNGRSGETNGRPGSVSTPPGAYPSGEFGTPGTTGTPGAQGGTPGAETGTQGLAGPPPGYLGFVTVGAEGRGEKGLVLDGYNLGESGAGSLLDKAVVVYEKAPDFTAGGDPGARQACGVIRKAGAPGTLGTR